MIAGLRRLQDIRFARYLAASMGALAVDLGLFLALLASGMLPALASAAGYSAGIVAHWLLSSRTVFTDNVAGRGLKRTRQKALFVASALLGLGVTTAIVGLADWLAVDPRAAKLLAIAASFMLTWVLRSRIVFRTTATGQA